MARSPGPGNDMSWEEVWERIVGKAREKGGKSPRKLPILWILLGAAVVIWLLTGIYTVGPGEEGVVKRFGEHVRTDGPGLHYHFSGIESFNRVNIEEIRTAEIGFRTLGDDQFQFIDKESQMLTGDENIVEAQVVVQYKVKDSAAYLFNVMKPEQVLHDATEVALRSVVGDHTIDFVMIEGRSAAQTEVMIYLQDLLDDYGSGLLVTTLKLQKVGPPEEVVEAFNQVQAAREDKQTKIREAEGYAADLVPKSRGEAEKMILEAAAYREQRILKAEGDASKFLQVLREHEVPAAFQVLAGDGVAEAIEVLSQLGAVAQIQDELITENVVGETVSEGIAAITSIEIQYLTEMTREKLFEILTRLGGTTGLSGAEELTGQNLMTALSELNLAEEFQQAYDEAIRLTQERLYLETMESILSGTDKFIVDSEASGNLVPFLPLKELTGSTQSPALPEQTEEAGQ